MAWNWSRMPPAIIGELSAGNLGSSIGVDISSVCFVFRRPSSMPPRPPAQAAKRPVPALPHAKCLTTRTKSVNSETLARHRVIKPERDQLRDARQVMMRQVAALMPAEEPLWLSRRHPTAPPKPVCLRPACAALDCRVDTSARSASLQPAYACRSSAVHSLPLLPDQNSFRTAPLIRLRKAGNMPALQRSAGFQTGFGLALSEGRPVRLHRSR